MQAGWRRWQSRRACALPSPCPVLSSSSIEPLKRTNPQIAGGLAAPAIAAGLGSAITLGGSTLGIAGAGAAGGTIASVFGTTAGAAVLGGSIGIAGGNFAGSKTVGVCKGTYMLCMP